MNTEGLVDFIVKWILEYTKEVSSKPISLVIGVSGGIDSAVTSTLCAKTNLKTINIKTQQKHSNV